jgi:hypothetical protein
MKNRTKTFVVGGLIVLAQAAVANVSLAANTSSAFPGAAEDGFIQLTAKTTYADLHSKDRAAKTASAFPGAAEDGFIQLTAKITYADLHSKDAVTSIASAFPGAAEDGFIQLSAKSTFADRHLDKPTRISQPTQDSAINAN